jgi:hypothetical protein
MFDWNDVITFTRKSNAVVQNWTSGSPVISSLGEPAYLEINTAGVTAGTLMISGKDSLDQSITEPIYFEASSTLLSTNQYKSITTLTPSWSSYTVNIKAVDIQGAPIFIERNFGPFPCSVNIDPTMSPAGTLGVPGQLKGAIFRISLLAFEPQEGDAVLTKKGYSGIVSNILAIPFPNFPTGWVFFLEENPG